MKIHPLIPRASECICMYIPCTCVNVYIHINGDIGRCENERRASSVLQRSITLDGRPPLYIQYIAWFNSFPQLTKKSMALAAKSLPINSTLTQRNSMNVCVCVCVLYTSETSVKDRLQFPITVTRHCN